MITSAPTLGSGEAPVSEAVRVLSWMMGGRGQGPGGVSRWPGLTLLVCACVRVRVLGFAALGCLLPRLSPKAASLPASLRDWRWGRLWVFEDVWFRSSWVPSGACLGGPLGWAVSPEGRALSTHSPEGRSAWLDSGLGSCAEHSSGPGHGGLTGWGTDICRGSTEGEEEPQCHLGASVERAGKTGPPVKHIPSFFPLKKIRGLFFWLDTLTVMLSASG